VDEEKDISVTDQFDLAQVAIFSPAFPGTFVCSDMRRFICFKTNCNVTIPINCHPRLLTADLFVYDVKQRKVYPITEIWQETNVWFDPNQRLVLCKFEQRVSMK